MSGFSYNGIHCSTFQCEYIPDGKERWFQEADFKIYSTDPSWKHGGYYFGNSAKIREFKLKCYFEEITIATREKIRRWLGRNTKGKLIFDDRPFVYYNVRPSDVTSGEIYNDTGKYSGTFTVVFTAYEPFGYLTRKYNTSSTKDGAEDYCGMIASSLMPAAPTVSDTSFQVYNPGTETCGLDIIIRGSTDNPIRFVNQRNGSVCVISSLPGSRYLDINGDTGFVKIKTSVSGTAYEPGFAYHDKGYIRLEPCETWTDVAYTAAENGSLYDITPTEFTVTEDMVGAYIQFNSPTTRNATVQAVNMSANKLTCELGGSGTFVASGKMRLSTMNKIDIQEQNASGNWSGPSSLSITTIRIDYQPRAL